MDDDVAALQQRIRAFAEARQWEQFHTPKNLVMALSGEAGELLSLFQWLTPEESATVLDGPQAGAVRDEVADVAIYLLRLVDVLGIDLVDVIATKLESNERRYPEDLARGSAAKYTELGP